MAGPIRYLLNPLQPDLPIARGIAIPQELVLDATHTAHSLIDQVVAFDIDLFPLLGMRNLSAFIGELFAASMVKNSADLFRKNPHQDGYPDLLLMDDCGREHWEELKNRLREKKPFSPFETGGIEVKSTCGSVPTPAVLAKRGLQKPDLGDQRISFLQGYDWKAHHQETNNLLAIFWDFFDRVPRIIATFYCSTLTREDWGNIVQPQEGGGRTTSVSIMTRAGVRKMFDHWVMVVDDKDYQAFFERRNQATFFV